MLHSLIKIGVGVIVGAILIKENKKASQAYDKAKATIKEVIKKISSKTEVVEKPVQQSQAT